jgi:hypothetical protein
MLSPVLSSSENRDPNGLRIEDIPNQVIARGIAARTNLANGMLTIRQLAECFLLIVRNNIPTHRNLTKYSMLQLSISI